MVLYQFENDRKYDRASDYLEGFNGVIQSDGYQAYANIKDIKKHGMFCSSQKKTGRSNGCCATYTKEITFGYGNDICHQ